MSAEAAPAAAPKSPVLLKIEDRVYRIGRTLGKGQYGKVKLGALVSTGQKFAVKFFSKTKLTPKEETMLARELSIVQVLDHPHIVHVFDVIRMESGKFAVVTEFCKQGEIFDFLLAHKRLREAEARRLFRQLLSAVDYIHSLGFVHRDIKLENVLLDSLFNVKLADFGFARAFAGSTSLRTSCGSPHYAAPEVLFGDEYRGPEVDIWSLGVLLYALLVGTMPYKQNTPSELRATMRAGAHYEPSSVLTPLASSLLDRMLCLDGKRRIAMAELRCHPWVVAEGEPLPVPFRFSAADIVTLTGTSELCNREITDAMASMGVTFDTIEMSGSSVGVDAATVRCIVAPTPEVTAVYSLVARHRQRKLAERELAAASATSERRKSSISGASVVPSSTRSTGPSLAAIAGASAPHGSSLGPTGMSMAASVSAPGTKRSNSPREIASSLRAAVGDAPHRTEAGDSGAAAGSAGAAANANANVAASHGSVSADIPISAAGSARARAGSSSGAGAGAGAGVGGRDSTPDPSHGAPSSSQIGLDSHLRQRESAGSPGALSARRLPAVRHLNVSTSGVTPAQAVAPAHVPVSPPGTASAQAQSRRSRSSRNHTVGGDELNAAAAAARDAVARLPQLNGSLGSGATGASGLGALRVSASPPGIGSELAEAATRARKRPDSTTAAGTHAAPPSGAGGASGAGATLAPTTPNSAAVGSPIGNRRRRLSLGVADSLVQRRPSVSKGRDTSPMFSLDDSDSDFGVSNDPFGTSHVDAAPPVPAPAPAPVSTAIDPTTRPRTDRTSVSASNTSARSANDLLSELLAVLFSRNVHFVQAAYSVRCTSGTVQFDIEIMHIPRLDLHSIRFARLAGDLWEYKSLHNEIICSLRL